MFDRHPQAIALRIGTVSICIAALAACGGGVNVAGSRATASATTSTVTTGTSSEMPATPAGLQATAGNAQANLTWNASTGAATYDIKRSTTSGGAYIQTASVASPSYVDASVKNGTTYYYVVSAVNSVGESADSGQASVTPDPTITTPPIPMGLITTAGNGQITLSWSGSSQATSYHVKRAAMSGGAYAQVAAPTATTYTDTSLVNGTTYFYVVSALDSAGESANSAEASAKPIAPAPTPTASIPAVPTGLAAISGNAQVALTWAASSGASSYNINRSTSSGGPFTQVSTSTLTSYTDSTVSNGATYYYVVAAADSSGASANSTQVSASPAAPPTKVVTGCSNLPAAGVWQQITPSGVDLSTFGIINVNLVPNNSASVYMGTSDSGLYKSVDCGANFVKINTGALSSDLSRGSMNPLIDPTNPSVIYTYSLYGTNGFFKSTDGGVNFKQILTPAITKYAPNGGFVSAYDMDPTNHNHLLVTWHYYCPAPYTSACYAETLDGGVTWTMRNGDASWNGGEGTFLHFLDGNRWLFSSAGNGMWLSKDQGKTWAQVPMAQASHGSGQLLRMTNGSFFMAAANGVLYSPDGESWEVLPNSAHQGIGNMGLATDGTNLWTSVAFPFNPDQRPGPDERYWQSSVSNMNTWTQMNTPSLSSGGVWLAYDSDHHILYSANYWSGMWRVVLQ